MKKAHPSRPFRAARFLVLALLCSLPGSIFPMLLLFGDTMLLRSSVVSVPPLIGKPIAEAETLDPSLYQRVTTEQYSDLPRGTIIAQDPPAGSRRKAVRGKRFVTISLYVSRGPAVTDIASVVGHNEEQARVTLQNQRILPVSDYVYHSAPTGTVIDQSPAAGTSVRYGESVRLTVSRGPLLREITLPSLNGLSEIEAKSLLNVLGLHVKTIIEQEDGASPENRVIAHDPIAGARLTAQSGVTLIVAVPPKKPDESDRESESENNNTPDTAETTRAEAESAEEIFPPDDTSTEDPLSPEDLFRSILDRIEQRFR